MPTIDDLRDALVAREVHAPQAESFALLERRSRQRFIAPAIAAAAVVALAGTAILVATRDDKNSQHPGGALPSASSAPFTSSVLPSTTVAPSAHKPLTWRFSVAKVPGYTITRYYHLAGTDGARIASVPAGGAQGQLSLVSAVTHNNELDRLRGKGVPISVGAKSGFFLAGTRPDTPNPVDDPDSQPQLAWEYEPGSWAFVSGTFGYDAATKTYGAASRTVEFRIAAAVTVGSTDRIDMPFAPGALPANLEPLITGAVPTARSCVGFGLPGVVHPLTENWYGGLLTLCRYPDGVASQLFGEPTDHVITRKLADGTTLELRLSARGMPRYPTSQLEKIVNDTDVTPKLADASTWLPIP